MATIAASAGQNGKFCKVGTVFVYLLSNYRFDNSEHRELYSNMGMRIEYTIFLMMRLKSFRLDIDKKIGSPGENAKNKKKSLQ